MQQAPHNIIFGDTKIFALEIAKTKKKEKHLLKMWLNGNSYGRFKRSGKLFRLKKELLRIINLEKDLFENVLTDISVKDFNEFRMCNDLPNIFGNDYDVFDPPQEILNARKEFERRKKYVFFPGDFFSDSISISISVNKGYIRLYFWEFAKKKNQYQIEEIPFSSFEFVASEFIKWFHDGMGNVPEMLMD